MDSEDDWTFDIIDPSTGEIFIHQTDIVHPGSGSGAWAGRNAPLLSDYFLEKKTAVNITGSKPALRFWHQYETEAGFDAGFLEIKDLADPLQKWTRLSKDAGIRDGYDGEIQYATFAIPFLYGFSGNSNGWQQSYFDLSDYSGKDITFRFRFGSDAAEAPVNGAWYIDEVEIMDLFNYAGEACITDNAGDQACASAPEYGVIVQPVTVGTEEPNQQFISMLVQPNPADDLLHISLGQALEGQVLATLVAADGRTVMNRSLQGFGLGQVLTLNVQNVPAGLYTVRLQSAAGNGVQKVVIR